MPYRCVTCGQDHDDLPHVGADEPESWAALTPAERAEQGDCNTDLCYIGGESFFIRGVIMIPVRDHPPGFGFGVWVSQKKENFLTYVETPQSADIGPFFGWLDTRLRNYLPADSRGLKTMAHFVGGGQRPRIEVDPEADHPLAVAQREGITLAQAWEIVHFYMDEPKKPRRARGKAK